MHRWPAHVGRAGMAAPGDVRAQLELVGLDEALRLTDTSGGTPAERARLRRRVEIAAEILAEPPGADELGFLHSVLCQCYLPRTRPAQNRCLGTAHRPVPAACRARHPSP